ncbi:MAG TPA: carboxylesterase family protein [Acidimicrobiia bacterium]|nr:carboxylesterase family protein [Acidimicrobiia bacterium]
MTGPVVETAAGKLEGAVVHAPDGTPVHRFLGVPYAAAPVGELRWRPPEPVPPWTGVRPALAFGPAAPQAVALDSPLPGFLADAGATSEDCLSLNVWAPADHVTPGRPVLVWIPGGAFMSGASAQAVYDGARLAAEAGAVVVTINYRLGALGFMDLGHEDAATNCGLRDQFAALTWVREHAAAFGADPGGVTVFGESAGAGSILQLLASPRRAGAFRRAVIQSCEPKVLTRDRAELVTRAFLGHLGLERADPNRLRELPVAAVLEAQGAAFAATMAATGMMPFHPVEDGDLVVGSPADALRAGRGAGVDLVIGTTRDELRLFPDPASPDLDRGQLARRVTRLLGDAPGAAETAIDRYLAVMGPHATPGDVWERIRTDTLMRVPTLRVAEAQAAHHADTYVYRFDWSSPSLGAAHATDVPFTFGNFDCEGWGAVVGADADAERLGSELRAAWAAFARTGDPSHDGIGTWPRYDADTRATMLFDRSCRVVTDADDVPLEVFGQAGSIR